MSDPSRDGDRAPVWRFALAVSVGYAVLAALWIVASDQVLAALTPDAATLSLLQTWKGWAFVALTSVLLYLVLILRPAHRGPALPPGGRLDDRRLHRIVAGSVAALVLVIAADLVHTLAAQRREILADAEVTTRNLVRVIEEQSRGGIDAVDVTLATTARALQLLPGRAEPRNAEIQALLVADLRSLPFVRAMWVLDAAGNMVHDSDNLPGTYNLSDREYFRIHRERPSTELRIDPPMSSKLGASFVPLSRRIDNADGSFAGVIVAALEPRYFETFYESIAVGNAGVLGLAMADGTLIARAPAVPALRGQKVTPLPRFVGELAKAERGTHRTISAVDGVERIYSYRKLANRPLVVYLGVGVDERLAGWQRTALANALASLAFVLVILWLGYLTLRELRRRSQLNHALSESESRYRKLAEQSPDAILIHSEGTIVLVNPALVSMLGAADASQLLGRPATFMLPADVVPAVEARVRKLYAGEAQPRSEQVYRRLDGTSVEVEIAAAPITHDGKPAAHVTVRDITARREAETRARRLSDFYAALSHTNRAIVRLREPAALYREICRICVEFGHAKIAFIGTVDGDRVLPVASAGPAEEFLAGIEIPLGSGPPTDRGPTATALREGRPYICNDFQADPATLPWRERAASIGTAASAALPIMRAGKGVAALILHVPDKGFFDAALVELLEEMVADISYALDKLEQERETRRAYERFEKIFLAAPEAMSISDMESGRLILVNDAFCATFGYSREELVDHSSMELGLWTDLLRRDTVLSALRAGRAVRGMEGQVRRRSGELRDVLYSGEVVEFGNDARLLLMFSDVTERKRAEARIRYVATHDSLTGLPNRDLVHDRITQAIAHTRRAGGHIALLYADLDRFKVINDGFGHPFGDTTLKAVADRLRAVVRECDTVARPSGDEFMILLDDMSRSEDIRRVTEKVAAAFARPFDIGGRELHLTVSIGVSVFPHDGDDADALIAAADAAMYRAKGMGRNTWQFYTREMSEETQRRFELETRLRVAIAAQQMHLVYHPKVDLQSGRITGCEALLRWTHPELGDVAPARFIPIAEDSGLIVPIGDWVLRTACAQNKAWQDAGLPAIPVSVNVSARQFLQHDVVAWVADALDATGLPAACLELEMTEGLIAQDTGKVIATVNALSKLGVRFSIDDFGTGYSSLSYLRHFRVDTLKIDQSFVREMLTEPDDAAIVRGMISLAHSLKLRVIAEGVGSAEQARFLRLVQCDEMQGYYFSEPVPAPAFAAMLAGGKRLEFNP